MNYIYLLYSRYSFKIGLGSMLKRRVEQIDKTTKGKQRLVFAVLVFKARSVETYLHRRYRKYNAPFRVGSGKSEWFRGGLWVCEAALLMVAISLLHWLVLIAAFYLILLIVLNIRL